MGTTTSEPHLSIGDASRLTGVSVDTLRYYERAGLMPDIRRDDGGRRRYTEDDCGWIAFIRRLRATAMPVGEIAEYAALVRAGEGTLAERRGVLAAHRDRVRAARAELTEALAILDRKLAHYAAAERGVEVGCDDVPVAGVRLTDV